MWMIYKMIYLFYCCIACSLLWMRRVTTYLAHIVSQNGYEWKPPQLWRPNSCGIFSVSSRHSPSQRPNLKWLATEIFSPALGYPVRVSCVCSIFSCDTPFYSLAAQLHIRAAVRTTSLRELKLLVWSADRDAAETRGADVFGQGTSATVAPACLVWTGWGRDEWRRGGKRGENKEGKKRRKKKQAEGNGLFIESVWRWMDRQTRCSVIRERDVCGGGWRTKAGTFEKNKRAAKKKRNSNKETILCAIPETCESVRHRVGERDLLMYRQVKDWWKSALIDV